MFGGVDFDYSDEQSTYNKLQITFQYAWFTIERNGKTLYKAKFKK